MKLTGISNILALVATSSLTHQAGAFAPLQASQITTKPSSAGRSLSSDPLFLLGGPDKKKIERDWTTIDANGEEYVSKGSMKTKIFLPEEGKVKGCAFFMHGFSQYTAAYEGTLQDTADNANVAVISVDTGIASWFVLGELLSDPLAMIKDRSRAQFVLQRALSEDTKQCIRMIKAGDEAFKEFDIGKNVPMGVCGHSMGGGLSFPVAAAFPSINYVFTMAPVAGVAAFDPIEEGVKVAASNNSMLLAGSWDLIGKSKNVEAISTASNEKKKNSSIFVEINKGLHTGFEDKLVITKIPLTSILAPILGIQGFLEKTIFKTVTSFLRTNTGQLDGSEALMEYFFQQMVNGKKVTMKDAEAFLDDDVKAKWSKNFDFSQP